MTSASRASNQLSNRDSAAPGATVQPVELFERSPTGAPAYARGKPKSNVTGIVFWTLGVSMVTNALWTWFLFFVTNREDLILFHGWYQIILLLATAIALLVKAVKE